MKKMIFVFLASSGFAVLPPFYQSVKEFQQLINHPRLCQLVETSEVITGIIRTETGYRVFTNRKMIEVEIRYGGDRKIIGPAQFEFSFSDPIFTE
jgi:hypothetical protein